MNERAAVIFSREDLSTGLVGMPIDGSAIELVSYWRKYMKEARSIAPVAVKSGPLLENVSSGKDVNIQTIPTPRWS